MFVSKKCTKDATFNGYEAKLTVFFSSIENRGKHYNIFLQLFIALFTEDSKVERWPRHLT